MASMNRHKSSTSFAWILNISAKAAHYLLYVLFTVYSSFKSFFKHSIEYKTLSDHETHNWIGRIKENNACPSCIELEGLSQTNWHLDKRQKNLLQEYDKEEKLFFDIGGTSKVDDGARSKSYCNFWERYHE